MNPLIALWSVMFFGVLAGITGAIAAVPAAAALQLALREVLRMRNAERAKRKAVSDANVAGTSMLANIDTDA